jgi:DUF4097 and DUF4098 domain-containing protein YvlB
MRTETFQTPGPVALALRIPAGKIELEAAATSETLIELEAKSPDAESEVRIDVRDRGDRQEILVEAPRRFFGTQEYRLRVSAPEGSSVEATTGPADIEARGAFGDFAVATASGDVIVQEIAGALAAKTASGDLIVQSVAGPASVQTASGDVILKRLGGEGTIRTASGDVVVKEAAAGLRIQTASGDQTVGSVVRGEVGLQSASGDIEVGIARGSSVYVDAHSASGDMHSELDLADDVPEGEGPLVELRAATMSGDVRVVRAV